MTTEFQELKQTAIDLLRERYNKKQSQRLADIDPRLREYYDDMLAHSSSNTDDPDDWHNVYEILGAAKFLRMLTEYSFNKKKVQTIIRLREGEWQRDKQGKWRHISGGLKCPGTSGAQVYRWQPFQVMILASVFGFYAWVDTKVRAEDKAELLPTERIKDGTIWDYRRVCTDFTYFGPRKTDKTGLAAYIQFVFFFFEDDNSEIYCCANSSDQAKLLYSRTRQLIAQMDGGNRIRSTQTVTDWRQAYKAVHDSSVRPLSAGGKTKDGMFAQLCCADEYGSSPYTNGKSDMLSLVNVIQSSMGPRREPMTFTTTTAGTISAGPFIEKLDALHRLLEREIDGNTSFEDDRRLCLCLEPDQWEREEQVILTKPTLRRKVNPMLGIIVQHSSYDAWIAEATGDSTKVPELLAKYFNVYQTGKVTKWITGDRIRPMQVPKTIDDCVYQEGWKVFVGCDYSHGDDLYALTYLAVNYQHKGPSMAHLMFADMEAWVLEKTMNESPNRALYEQWVNDGWLHVSPGEVFDPILAINAMASHLFAPDDNGNPDEQRMRLDIHSFGYDPAQSVTSVNTLKAWLQSIFTRRGMSGGDIANALKAMVVPVPQSAMVFNPIIGHLEEIILAPEPWIDFSMNPMWAWQFNNVAIEIGRSDLRRFVKGGPAASHKHDNISALGDAMYLFDLSENRVSE